MAYSATTVTHERITAENIVRLFPEIGVLCEIVRLLVGFGTLCMFWVAIIFEGPRVRETKTECDIP
jgi:hypothetical protein